VQPIRLPPPLKSDDDALISEMDCAMRRLAFSYGSEILASSRSDSPERVQQLKSALLWPALVQDYCSGDSFVLNVPSSTTETSPTAAGRRGRAADRAGVSMFVSAGSGSDASAGTIDAPFRSLQRAQQQVRSIVAKGGGVRPPITVYVRGGTYQVNQTLVFGPADGGIPSAPVLWTAYQHETVVISGGRQLDGLHWEPAGAASGLGARVMKATLPNDAAQLSSNWTALFVGGRRAIWARWPNGDPSADSGLVSLLD
jgi:hypothetical protein